MSISYWLEKKKKRGEIFYLGIPLLPIAIQVGFKSIS
jgi:hypothetical protein